MEEFVYDKKYLKNLSLKLLLIFFLISVVLSVIDTVAAVVMLCILVAIQFLDFVKNLQMIQITKTQIHIFYKIQNRTETIDISKIRSISKLPGSLKIPWEEGGLKITTSNKVHKISYAYFPNYRRLRQAINKIHPISA